MSTEGTLKAVAQDVRTGKQISTVLEGSIMSDTERRAATERIDKLARKIE